MASLEEELILEVNYSGDNSPNKWDLAASIVYRCARYIAWRNAGKSSNVVEELNVAETCLREAAENSRREIMSVSNEKEMSDLTSREKRVNAAMGELYEVTHKLEDTVSDLETSMSNILRGSEPSTEKDEEREREVTCGLEHVIRDRRDQVSNILEKVQSISQRLEA